MKCVAAVLPFSLLPFRLATAAAADAADLPLLTTTAQVHALSADEARRTYPVRLRGVVTFYDQKHFDTCFVSDETGSLSVLTTGKQFHLTIGELIEMRGVSDPGSFAPMIRALEVVSLGRGELPAPRKVSYETIATGHEDAQWVELSGVVRSAVEDRKAERLVIEIATGGGRLMTRVRDYDRAASYEHLVDAAVRVRGVCAQLFNQKRQMFNVRLLVPSLREVIVDEPAPADPFAMPVRSIVSLLQFPPEGIYGRRVRVQGVVIFQQPGQALFIRDDAQSMLVRTKHAAAVEPGDRVDVVGFPAMGEWTPILHDATFRKIGRATPQPPAAVTAAEVLTGVHDAALVQIDGTIVDRVQRLNEEILVLQSGGLVFDAAMKKAGSADELADFPKGSKVRLNGICQVEVGDGRVPRAFRLLLRSPQDVALLERPSWWTLTRLLWSLGGVSLATLSGWIWVAALGQRVRQQTGIIAQKLQREAALEERTRLAREFHDTLEQEFTGIRLQLEAVKSKFTEAPGEAQEYLDVARSLIRRSHAEARRAVWDLRADVLERHDLSTALAQTIAQAANGAAPARVVVFGKPRRLPGWVENHLLRIGQEAVTNAIKHAAAGEICVELDFQTDTLRLRIRDNGRGFDASGAAASELGHFGLLGMKERAEKIRGRFEIVTAPGSGTSIEVSVPFAAIDATANARP
jgi:signal transduction histidine kinase